MLEMRRDLEGPAAERAALKMRGQKPHRALEAAFKDFREVVAADLSDAALRKDRLFHWEIFRMDAAGNSPGGAFDQAQVYALDELPYELAKHWNDKAFRQEMLRRNQQLFESIMRCDPAAARTSALRYVEYLASKHEELRPRGR